MCVLAGHGHFGGADARLGSIDPSARAACRWKPPAAETSRRRPSPGSKPKSPTPTCARRSKRFGRKFHRKPPEDEALVRLVETFAVADPRRAKLLAICSQPRSQLIVPAQPWLSDRSAVPLFATISACSTPAGWSTNCCSMKPQEQLAGWSRAMSWPPPRCFLSKRRVPRAVESRVGLKSIDELLQGEQTSPRRYVALARLMLEDLKGLQDDTLDHIARRMEDIRPPARSRPVARANKCGARKTGVVQSLDKLIKNVARTNNRKHNRQPQRHPIEQPRQGKPNHRRQRPATWKREEFGFRQRLGSICRP